MNATRHAAEIRAAAERVRPYVRRTPLLDLHGDGSLLVKCESLQVSGSFKVRGAFNALLRLAESGPVPGVLATSSGNHAQAVARAAASLGVPACIVIPADASPYKTALTRSLGAEVLSEGVTNLNREQRLAQVADERGWPVVHPFDDWDVIHGQAGVGVEILAQCPQPGLVVVPVSGGGLVSGIALALAVAGSAARVVGVEPAAAADAARSLATRNLTRMQPGPTIADGARAPAIGRRGFEVIVEQGLVDCFVQVDDDEVVRAVRHGWERARLVLEPTGALTLAAALSGRLPTTAGPTVLVASGANIAPDDWAALLADPGGRA